MPKSYSLREASEITNTPYTTLHTLVRKGLLTNPITDEDVYAIILYGWESFRIKRKREKRDGEKETEKSL